MQEKFKVTTEENFFFLVSNKSTSEVYLKTNKEKLIKPKSQHEFKNQH